MGAHLDLMKPYAAVLALLTLAAGCAAERTARPPAVERGIAVRAAGIEPGVVDGSAAHRLVALGVEVVDVRTPEEFRAGHIAGAVNIPYDQMGSRHRELGPPSTPVLLYCRTGHRSGLAAQTLREKGFTELYDLQSYGRWSAAEPAAGAR